MQFLVSLILSLNLLLPYQAHAQQAVGMKSPLSYSLYEYGAMLGIAMLGGLVRWVLAVRRGEAIAYNLAALIGELCVSAFVGLITFWVCEALAVPPLWTIATVGIGGHLGAKGLLILERGAKRLAEKRLGIDLDETDNAPLGPQ